MGENVKALKLNGWCEHNVPAAHCQHCNKPTVTQLQSALDAVTAERDGLKSRVQPILDLLEKHPWPWSGRTGYSSSDKNGDYINYSEMAAAINAFAAGFEAGEGAGR